MVAIHEVKLDILDCFQRLVRTEKPVRFLHSGQNEDWSILAFNPVTSLVYDGHSTLVNGERQPRSVWSMIAEITGERSRGWRKDRSQLSDITNGSPSRKGTLQTFPFEGGAIGYFAYELGYELQNLESKHRCPTPLINLHWYNEAVVYHRSLNKTFILSPDPEATLSTLAALPPSPKPPPVSPRLHFTPFISREEYLSTVNAIKQKLYDGEIYQACYTYQLESNSHDRGHELFLRSLRSNPAQMSAYLRDTDHEIISASPERFLRVHERTVSTFPIKGTRPRGQTEIEDQRLLLELLESEKEKAELIMITDLLRNDLGKVSETGSVRVPELRSVVKLPTVWHTCSSITSRLRSTATLLDLIRATFPGGSITGCPKRRAMSILSHLESTPRGVYTGAIGYLSDNGNMDLNIAIRTLVKTGPHLQLGVGSGIVADSSPEEEYRETLAKAGSFML